VKSASSLTFQTRYEKFNIESDSRDKHGTRHAK